MALSDCLFCKLIKALGGLLIRKLFEWLCYYKYRTGLLCNLSLCSLRCVMITMRAYVLCIQINTMCSQTLLLSVQLVKPHENAEIRRRMLWCLGVL